MKIGLNLLLWTGHVDESHVPVLKALKNRMDLGRYNGASLLGLKGIVVKSHGSADVFAFGQALRRAVEEVENRVIERISSRMDGAMEAAK